MALGRLWRALTGSSNRESSPADATASGWASSETPSPSAPAPTEPAPESRGAGEAIPAAKITNAKRTQQLRSYFGDIEVLTVLELNVGDGSLVSDLVAAIKMNQPIRYVAVDQFDLGDGPMTVKRYHQLLKSLGVKPLLIPGTVDQGMKRVANTIGAVDAVIARVPEGELDDALSQRLLSDVLHDASVVLRLDPTSGEIAPIMLGDSNSSRRAA
ncbi:MAG: hypothetical protein AAFP90_11800 [Planctomycetota bacterium]